MAVTDSAKRRKLDRDTTAAYAASQPLFDALRNGVAKAAEQKIHLQKARDTVQGLHVKLVDTTSIDDAEKHELYMDCAVKAWRNATEVFSDIFEELCKISAADPAQGRKAGAHYEEFEKLAWTARTAKQAAAGYLKSRGDGGSGTDASTTPGRSQTTKSTTATPKSEKKTSQPTQPPMATRTATRTPAPAKRLRSPPTPDAEDEEEEEEPPAKRVQQEVADPPNNQPKTTESAGAPDARAEKNKRKRAARREKRKSNTNPAGDADGKPELEQEQGDNTPSASAEPAPMPAAGKENTIPGVEYEDVSAEVAARIKAKAEKRKASRKEKKRKRESGDSITLADTVIGAGAGAAVAEARPSKKRVKGEGAGGATVGAGVEKMAKRKQDTGAAEGVEAGAKKRKKV